MAAGANIHGRSSPASASAALGEAQGLADAGDFAAALSIARSALTDAPCDRDLLRITLRCLRELGQPELALVAARSLQLADPGAADATAARAELESALQSPRPGPEEPLGRALSSSLPAAFVEQLQRGLAQQSYKGRQLLKNPLDLQLYRSLIWDLRPATIVEVGSKAGGSALYFADLLRCAAIDGRILSLDVLPVIDVQDELVDFRFGDGRDLAPALGRRWRDSVRRPLLVIEDADHAAPTTRAVLRFFDDVLKPGDWIVVEGSQVSDTGTDLHPDGFSGPARGLRDFLLATDNRYRVGAEYCDFYGYNWTSACNGFLERIA